MNRYLIICRLRWPAILLLTGVIALLVQADVLSWGRAWPLYLILWGVLALAERATLASNPPADFPFTPGYQAAGYAPQPGPYQQTYQQGTVPVPAPEPPSTGIVPAHGSVESLSHEPRKSWEEEGR